MVWSSWGQRRQRVELWVTWGSQDWAWTPFLLLRALPSPSDKEETDVINEQEAGWTSSGQENLACGTVAGGVGASFSGSRPGRAWVLSAQSKAGSQQEQREAGSQDGWARERPA